MQEVKQRLLSFKKITCSDKTRILRFRESKYDQDLDFGNVQKQLNYRRKKEQIKKKLIRLKKLQKLRQDADEAAVAGGGGGGGGCSLEKVKEGQTFRRTSQIQVCATPGAKI